MKEMINALTLCLSLGILPCSYRGNGFQGNDLEYLAKCFWKENSSVYFKYFVALYYLSI